MLRDAYAQSRPVPVIGVTGPPGAGKSTLLDRLALHWAESGLRVALVMVDPSSPYTGGALLGDRYRMDRASAHPDVFVRSLSSRGHVGGLSRAVQDVTVLLGALGFDIVLVETVGSGQADLEIAQLSDCVVVVAVPGLGDQIQAAKAGILEIGDLFAVNKADTPGADTVIAQLRANLDLVYPGEEGVNTATRPQRHAALPANAALQRRHGGAGEGESFWRPPVLKVSAVQGEGISGLGAGIDSFLAWQRATGHHEVRRAERVRSHVLRLATAQLLDEVNRCAVLPGLLAEVAQGNRTPEAASRALLDCLHEARARAAAPSGED